MASQRCAPFDYVHYDILNSFRIDNKEMFPSVRDKLNRIATGFDINKIFKNINCHQRIFSYIFAAVS